MRAFIAIEINERVAHRISTAIADLQPSLPSIRRISSTNFHFTLKFLGNIEETRVAPITQALEDALRPFPWFTINAKGLGVFPGLKRPRVLWIGLEGKELAELASKVERALEPLGFEREKRELKPHLTVGRWREFNGRIKGLEAEIERWKDREFGQSPVVEVILFRSELKRDGAVYHRLKVMPLAH